MVQELLDDMSLSKKDVDIYMDKHNDGIWHRSDDPSDDPSDEITINIECSNKSIYDKFIYIKDPTEAFPFPFAIFHNAIQNFFKELESKYKIIIPIEKIIEDGDLNQISFQLKLK